MKRVYTAPNAMLAGHIQVVLEQHGISAFLRNVFLIGGAGELPPNECFPEVWIVENHEYERARAIIAELLEAPPGKDWRCPRCDEEIEGQFAACWACGAEAPSEWG